MIRYDRVISFALICIGAAMVLYSLFSNASEHTISAMRFVGVDMIFFSWISYLSPRSNADLKEQAFSAGRFLALSLATVGVVIVSIYLAAGLPRTPSEALMLTMLIVALPAAIIVPVIVRGLQTKRTGAR